MRTAILLRDGVGEAQHRLVITVGPLHRNFEQDAVALAADHDRCGMQGLLGAVEIAHEGLEPAFKMKRNALRLDPAQIVQYQGHAAVQKGELA